jgi:hypothetical protein
VRVWCSTPMKRQFLNAGGRLLAAWRICRVGEKVYTKNIIIFVYLLGLRKKVAGLFGFVIVLYR